MDNIAGSPVQDENFFGREEEVEDLKENLANDDVLLLGPRRIGKTSIARAVIAAVKAEGWRAIEINVASCADEREFLQKLSTALTPELASLSSRATTAIGNAFTAITSRIKSVKIPIPGAGSVGVELGQDSNNEDWTKVACEVLELIAQADERWLIYVDELPILLFNIIHNDSVNGVQRVRRFLDWFRNDVRALSSASTKVRWLVSGSVGLDTLVQQHHMADTINSLNHRGLEAFEEGEAIEMLMTLAKRYSLPLLEKDARNIVVAVQWPQPYYLQKVFNHLRTLVRTHRSTNLSDLIGKAIDKLVQPGSDNDFHHWEQRLSMQLSQADAAHAIALLNYAAGDREGVRPESLFAVLQERMQNVDKENVQRTFSYLRDILQRDAYLWLDNSSEVKRYKFRLEPLRLWWLRRNEL